LSPACTSCGFVNTILDRFCGGCGTSTAPARPKRLSALPQLTPRARPPKPPPKGKTIPIDRVDDAVLSETGVQVDETW
jgi:hypothetical protein